MTQQLSSVPESVLEALRAAAARHGLDPLLVLAIAQHESICVPWKTRFEPRPFASGRYDVFPREHASRLGISEQTERVGQNTSWGLMQVMGFVARELGFDGYLTQLCDLELGPEYGCRQLKRMLQRWGEEEKAVAAYNAGSPRMTSAGMYENQRYVDSVYRILRELRRLD